MKFLLANIATSIHSLEETRAQYDDDKEEVKQHVNLKRLSLEKLQLMQQFLFSKQKQCFIMR
jgi:hypothetical protein